MATVEARGGAAATAAAHRWSLLRSAGQVGLGLLLLGAGAAHLTLLRQEFQAQVPPWVPVDADAVVVGSGVVELVVGGALLVTWRHPGRALVGAVAAAFFVAVLPGNISELVTRTDAFGLDTDTARAVRLLFQPLLVLWALVTTGAGPVLRRVLARSARSAGRSGTPGRAGRWTPPPGRPPG